VAVTDTPEPAASFAEARQEITGGSWLDVTARMSLSAAEAKFTPAAPDLTRELDEAEAIVTGRAEAIVTQWGSRDPGGLVFVYGADAVALSEATARSAVQGRRRHGSADVLLRRTVTYGPWEDVPDA
jgi:hypothetical protein